MVVLGKDDIELIEGSKGWMERLQKLKCNAESVGRLETEIVTARDKKEIKKEVKPSILKRLAEKCASENGEVSRPKGSQSNSRHFGRDGQRNNPRNDAELHDRSSGGPASCREGEQMGIPF